MDWEPAQGRLHYEASRQTAAQEEGAELTDGDLSQGTCWGVLNHACSPNDHCTETSNRRTCEDLEPSPVKI